MNSSPLYSLHHGRFHERKSSFNLNRKSKQLRKDGMFPRLCMSFLPFLRKQNLPLYIKQLTKGFGLSSSEGCFYISNFPNCARHTNCGFTFPMTCPGGWELCPSPSQPIPPYQPLFPKKPRWTLYISLWYCYLLFVCGIVCVTSLYHSPKKIVHVFCKKNDVATLLSSSYLPFHSLIDSSET